MTIQERSLNGKQFGSKFSAEWSNEKILREVLTMLWRFCVFLTTGLVERYDVTEKRPGCLVRFKMAAHRVEFWPSLERNFIGIGCTLEAKTTVGKSTSCYLFISFNVSRLRKQICIKLTFILFQKVLKSTELLLGAVAVDHQTSDSRCSKIFAVRLPQIISSLCFAVGFWEVQSIKRQNLQGTCCVLNEYSPNCCNYVTKSLGTGDSQNQFLALENQFTALSNHGGTRQDCVTCTVTISKSQSARENLKKCHRNRWLTSTKTTFGRWKKFLEDRVLE